MGHVYYFRVRTWDNVSNERPYPETPDASTSIRAPVTKHYYANGQRVATRVDGTLYYVHSDLLGSTVALSNDTGQPMGWVQYDPYGEILTSTLPLTLTDRLFTGQRLDSSTGLYYYNARYYDPDPSASLRAGLGRFIQPDTLVPDPLNPQAWNRFSYCYNNPATYIDPSGHIPLIVAVPLLIAGGAIILDYGLQVHSNMSNYGMPFWEAGYHENINEWEMVNVGATAFMVTTLAIEAPALLLAGGGALATEYAMRTGSTRAFAIGMWLSNAAAEYSAFWWAGVVSEAEALQAADMLDDASGALRLGEAGRFGDLRRRAVLGDNLTPHHMPQRALRWASADEGGALMMTSAEHAQTRTFGWRGAQTAVQDAGRSFRDVLAADIWDVRSIAGSRYNEGLLALIDYYRTNFPHLMAK